MAKLVVRLPGRREVVGSNPDCGARCTKVLRLSSLVLSSARYTALGILPWVYCKVYSQGPNPSESLFRISTWSISTKTAENLAKLIYQNRKVKLYTTRKESHGTLILFEEKQPNARLLLEFGQPVFSISG